MFLLGCMERLGTVRLAGGSPHRGWALRVDRPTHFYSFSPLRLTLKISWLPASATMPGASCHASLTQWNLSPWNSKPK